MRGILTRDIFRSSSARWAAVLLLLAAGASSPFSSQSASQSSSQSPLPAAPAETPQQPGAANPDIPRIRVGTNEVNVVFTVTDKHGKLITDLKQPDFHFVDDNKPVTEIRSFSSESNLPLQVGLLIDASNSVRDRFKFEQESAIEFLNQTVRRGYDLAMVVGFDVTPEGTQEFTESSEKRDRGLRGVRPGGRT